jgi:hypothetical protein
MFAMMGGVGCISSMMRSAMNVSDEAEQRMPVGQTSG